MIRQSFIFLDKIQQKSEKKIWESGVKDWNDFLQRKEISGMSSSRKLFYDNKLKEAKEALYNYDLNYFYKKIPSTETWRLYPFFKDEALFLDIETCYNNGQITVIGMYDGKDTKTMIRGANFSRELLLDELNKHSMLITFNGRSFDIPLLEKYFGIKIEIPHLDLRHLCARIGLRGGLKQIEKQLGITRAKDVQNVTGADAAKLWDIFIATGDEYYLDLLIKYNEEDIINLKPIADFAVKELWEKIFK